MLVSRTHQNYAMCSQTKRSADHADASNALKRARTDNIDLPDPENRNRCARYDNSWMVGHAGNPHITVVRRVTSPYVGMLTHEPYGVSPLWKLLTETAKSWLPIVTPNACAPGAANTASIMITGSTRINFLALISFSSR